MGLFEWNDVYDVGVDNMNAEHHMLIELMNRLHELHVQQAPNDIMAPVFRALVAYTVKHFRDEEAHMAAINYPRLKSHARTHQDLLTELGAHQRWFDAGKPLGPAFFSFLKLWLSSHIAAIDRQYSPQGFKKAS